MQNLYIHMYVYICICIFLKYKIGKVCTEIIGNLGKDILKGAWRGRELRGGCLAVGRVHVAQLPSSQHQDVFLLLVEAQLLACQAGVVQLPLSGGQLSRQRPWHTLLPAHPVQCHLVTNVIIQGPV